MLSGSIANMSFKYEEMVQKFQDRIAILESANPNLKQEVPISNEWKIW